MSTILLLLILGSAAEPSELLRLTRLNLSSMEDSGTCVTSDNLVVTSIAQEGERATVEAVVEQVLPSGATRVVYRTIEWTRERGVWRLSRVWPTEEKLAASVRDTETLARLRARLQEDPFLRNVSLSRALTARAYQQSQSGAADIAYELGRIAMDVSADLGDRSGMARALFVFSTVERQRGKVGEALAGANDSLFLAELSGDADAMALAYNNLGRIYGASRDRLQAAAFYRKALDHEPRVSDRRIIVSSLNNLGTNAGIRGDFLSALQYYNHAAEIAKELGLIVDQATADYNIAEIYRLQGGDPERALKRFEIALPVFRDPAAPKRFLAGALSGIGQSYRALGRNDKAAEYDEQAMSLAAAIGDFRTEGLSSSELGEMKFESGELDGAWKLLEKTLDIGKRIDDTELQSYALPRMAEIRIRRNDPAGAVRLAEDAVEAARKSRQPAAYVDAITVAGRVYRLVGRVSEARARFIEAIEKYEEMRNRVVGGEEEVERGFENKLSPYLELVDLLVDRGETSAALAVAERSKARLLLDVLSNGRTEITKSLTAKEKETEQVFRNEIAQLNRAIQNEEARKAFDKARVDGLLNQLEGKRAAYEAFQTDLYVKHPELKVTWGRAEPLVARDLEALHLPSHDLSILEFVVTDERTHAFLIGLTSGTSKISIVHYAVPVKKKELERRVNALTTQLSGRDYEFRAHSRALYEMLFAPIAKQLARARVLCVIPDAALWNVPFEALLDSKGRYLIESFAIFRAPSVSVLAMNANRKVNRAPGGLLAFGNPAVGATAIDRVRAVYRSENLGSLPEAETEVRSLARLYGPRSRIYIGAAATEATAKAEMPGYRVIHFATHAVLFDRNPLYSHLLLSPSKIGSDEDGLLEAREMLNLDLQCDLVVLSACETARGRIGAGEGLIGMAWAMFVAGARAAVVSQWKVESQSTTQVMIEFHRQLLKTSSVASRDEAEALRQAQLDLLRYRRYRHPYYWSAFVLVATRW